MVLLRSCVSKNDNHQSAEDTTEKNHAILSCLRNFDFFVNIFCRGSALRASPLPIVCRSFGTF